MARRRASSGSAARECCSLTYSEFSALFGHFHPFLLTLPWKANRRKDRGNTMSEIKFLGHVGQGTFFHFVTRATLETQGIISHLSGKEMEFLRVDMGFLSF